MERIPTGPISRSQRNHHRRQRGDLVSRSHVFCNYVTIKSIFFVDCEDAYVLMTETENRKISTTIVVVILGLGGRIKRPWV